jgi:plastocyanin
MMPVLTERRLWIPALLSLVAAAVPARADTIQVGIVRLVFSPAEINAKVGDTVEWINKDALVHSATVKGGWEVMVPAKKTGSLVLQTAGQFDYYCRFHPNMKGHISVAP